MSKYEYQLPSMNIWLSFDGGTIEADSAEEARLIAEVKLRYDLEKCNEALKHSDNTKNFSVDIDFEQLEIKQVEV